MLLGAFLVEFSVEIVLQESVDNCLLISNPLVGEFLCNTFSKLPVQRVLTASTGAMRHLKSNGFMRSSVAIRESNAVIWIVSEIESDIEIVVQKLLFQCGTHN
jgi:hypothetical protein